MSYGTRIMVGHVSALKGILDRMDPLHPEYLNVAIRLQEAQDGLDAEIEREKEKQ